MEIELSILVDARFREKVDQERLQGVVRQALRQEEIGRPLTLGLLITNDERIKSLNLKYRGQDTVTDVLAFGGEPDDSEIPSPPSAPAHLGDLVVSYPRAASQARMYGHSTGEELERLVVHGLLHLLGYRDEGDDDRQTMWDRQEAILREAWTTRAARPHGVTGGSVAEDCACGDPSEDTKVTGSRSLAESFRYAFAGFWHTLRHQRNSRIHLAIAIAAVIVGVVLNLKAVEWAVISLTIGFVFAAEMFNTALEALIDMVTEEYHPLAKQAKDIAAGAVLVSAVAAVAVGLLVLGPALLARLGWAP